MVTNLQSIDPDRLGLEEGISEDACIFLGGENRIDFMGKLRVRCGDMNNRRGGKGEKI